MIGKQRVLTDVYGGTVTVSADGVTYSVVRVDGFAATVKPNIPGDDKSAMFTINSMAPATPTQ